MKTNSDVKKRRECGCAPAQTIPRIIGFRLSEDEAQDLAERATDEGISPHQMAHDLVLKWLDDAENGAESDKTEALQRQLFELREELALVTEVLLACAGKVTASEARKWVDQNLKPKE